MSQYYGNLTNKPEQGAIGIVMHCISARTLLILNIISSFDSKQIN